MCPVGGWEFGVADGAGGEVGMALRDLLKCEGDEEDSYWTWRVGARVVSYVGQVGDIWYGQIQEVVGSDTGVRLELVDCFEGKDFEDTVDRLEGRILARYPEAGELLGIRRVSAWERVASGEDVV